MDVETQSDALRRIKEMGLFPIRVSERHENRPVGNQRSGSRVTRLKNISINIPFFSGRVKPAAICAFTRQLATLVDAGMPLIRGLRLLREQETNATLKRIITEVESAIENGSTLSEALTPYPRVFNRLYINMVKAGELSGALEITLLRLAEFIEKAQKIKGKVKAAMFYPAAVLFIATAILIVMMIFVVPRFKQVFEGLVPGGKMPVFSAAVFSLSDVLKAHYLGALLLLAGLGMAFTFALRSTAGRGVFDRFKLKAPVFGKIFRKVAISRFSRTLGTLLNNGVPILQALTIVKETVGNVMVSNVVSNVHDSVKEGETITAPLRASGVFPPVVVGMVDVGEQTGALPDMLLKVADGCDEEVDNAVSAMTSLIEPFMIVFLAVVVGSLVVAMYLPILSVVNPDKSGPGIDGTDN